jgi:hypothetical protein
MKKLFLLATIATLMGSSVTFASDGGKDKTKGSKPRTEKKCPKPCPEPCPPCCKKGKCEKS